MGVVGVRITNFKVKVFTLTPRFFAIWSLIPNLCDKHRTEKSKALEGVSM